MMQGLTRRGKKWRWSSKPWRPGGVRRLSTWLGRPSPPRSTKTMSLPNGWHCSLSWETLSATMLAALLSCRSCRFPRLGIRECIGCVLAVSASLIRDSQKAVHSWPFSCDDVTVCIFRGLTSRLSRTFRFSRQHLDRCLRDRPGMAALCTRTAARHEVLENLEVA